jgi:hypothetical protein
VPKQKPSPRKPTTYFKQVPVSVAKKAIEKDAAKPDAARPKNVVSEPKSEPYSIGAEGLAY